MPIKPIDAQEEAKIRRQLRHGPPHAAAAARLALQLTIERAQRDLDTLRANLAHFERLAAEEST